MFKLIRRLITLVILLIIIVPAALIVLAFIDDTKPPIYLKKEEIEQYQDVEKVCLSDINQTVFQFISGDRTLRFHEINVNKTIYGYFAGFDKDAENRIGKEIDNFYVEGIWVDVEDNHLILYTKLSYMRPSTTISAKVNVDTTDDEVILTLSAFKIGKLSLPKFVFTKLLEKLQIEVKEGEIIAQTVQLKIKKEVIQRELENAMDNKLIRFEDIVLNEDEVVIYYDLNTSASSQAEIFQQAIDKIKNVVQNDSLVSNIENKLNELDIPAEDQDKVDDFLADLNAVNDLLKDKLNNPSGVTDDELELLLELQESFETIPNQQEVIIEAFEATFDADLINDINQLLSDLGYSSIADLIFGK